MTGVFPANAFVVREPLAAPVPVVVSIPHTGEYLSSDLRRRLVSDAMRALPMTDWYLDALYDFVPRLGVTSIHATWSRFAADLNRPPEPRPLYPGRFETGLVPERTFDGAEIWAEYPDQATIADYRAAVHAPYHARLLSLIEATRERFGRVVLIDAHSVASRANKLHGELRKDIYLGNRDGAACDNWLMDTVAAAFEDCNLQVSRNHPYKGGFITDHYGRMPGVDALQIEMCQRLYMDERGQTRAHAVAGAPFAVMRARLQAVFEAIIAAQAVGGRT